MDRREAGQSLIFRSRGSVRIRPYDDPLAENLGKKRNFPVPHKTKVFRSWSVSSETKERNTMLKPLAVILALASFPVGMVAAGAQDMVNPGIWGNGLLGQNAMDNARENTRRSQNQQRKKPQQRVPAQPELDAAAQARVRAAVRALVPEYNARARRDGEESANEWIRQKGFELGQQEAERMEQRRGRK